MLQKITDTIETHKWLWYSILGALALVFAAWGAYGIVNLNFSTSSYAAEAGGQTISLDEAHNAWLRAIEDGIHTYDIYSEGASTQKVGTKEFACAVIARLGQKPYNLRPVSYSRISAVQRASLVR